MIYRKGKHQTTEIAAWVSEKTKGGIMWDRNIRKGEDIKKKRKKKKKKKKKKETRGNRGNRKRAGEILAKDNSRYG